ncbi:hypothetical protein BH10BAC6_BH10BAC6_12520 [soil metagenome]
MQYLVFLLLLCWTSYSAVAQSRPLYRATQRNIGYTVPLSGASATDTTLGLQLRYRNLLSADFMQAPVPVRCAVRGVDQFRGSILLLEPGASYVIEAMFSSATGRFAPFIDTITTLRIPLILPQDSIKVVSPSGSGTAYSETQPGDLRTLLSAGVRCGTTVFMKGGTYEVANLTLTLTEECDTASQIVLTPWPGDSVVFDGGATITSAWTPVPGSPGMYSTSISADFAFTSLCTFDGERLYPYAFLQPNSLVPSYPTLQNLGYDASGFYRAGNVLYVKTLDGTDPTGHVVRVSKAYSWLTVKGNSHGTSVVIRDIHVRDYGGHVCNVDALGFVSECYPSYTLRLENVNNAIIDNCTFTNSNAPISFFGACNTNTVRNCRITDGTGYWSHGAFKQTRDQSIIDIGSFGRYLEHSGIAFAPGDDDSLTGNCIHNNTVNGTVGGITAGWITARAVVSDHDVYDNIVTNCYDGIDCTGGAGGGSMNVRIWNNRVLGCPVGTSLIGNSFQATYIMRNVYQVSSRLNHNNDVFFVNCDNSIATSIWCTALKLNAGDTTRGTGAIHFVHNTVYATGQFGFDLYLWNPTWKSLFSRNNIYASLNGHTCMFDGIANATTYAFDSDGDVYYAYGQPAIATIRPVHGVPTCELVATPDELQGALRSTTQSPLIHIGTKSIQRAPDFVDANANDFHLITTSGIIDAGVVVDGFTTAHSGSAPDPGAYEGGATTSVANEDSDRSDDFDAHAIVRTQIFTLLGEELAARDARTGALYFVRQTDATGNVRTTATIVQP